MPGGRSRSVFVLPLGRPLMAADQAGMIHLKNGDRLTCGLEGDVAPFLAAIAFAKIHDLTIEPTSLEDAFLEFYADDLVTPVAR